MGLTRLVRWLCRKELAKLESLRMLNRDLLFEKAELQGELKKERERLGKIAVTYAKLAADYEKLSIEHKRLQDLYSKVIKEL